MGDYFFKNSRIQVWIIAFLLAVVATPFHVMADEIDDADQVAESPHAPEDLLMESTPVKAHEAVFVEDVEAQIKEAHEEAKLAAKEIQKTDLAIQNVREKNYGAKKKLQKETLAALERKRKADSARLRVWVQREKLQREILVYEKRRAQVKEQAHKAENSAEESQSKLTELRHDRWAAGESQKPVHSSARKSRRIHVNFGENQKDKNGVADAK